MRRMSIGVKRAARDAAVVDQLFANAPRRAGKHRIYPKERPVNVGTRWAREDYLRNPAEPCAPWGNEKADAAYAAEWERLTGKRPDGYREVK